MRAILITGGAGFIGSHLVKRMVRSYPNYHIINLDKLTYAGNLENLIEVEKEPNYSFVKGDICDRKLVERLFKEYKIDGVIHLAAESHVDRSIEEPLQFAESNVMGTLTLLQVAKESWSLPSKGGEDDHSQEGESSEKRNLFYHVSTDEVYGSLELDGGLFTEETPYDPHSPYSASKAASDHFVRAYRDTYNFPVIISNCSNNYGSHQFPEKLIPLFIRNIKEGLPLPIYGKGENVRDWLYVEDHVEAIDLLFHKGKLGETYNIGGFNEWKNIDLVKLLIATVDRELGNAPGSSEKLIRFVTDRAGHDLRYAIDATKLERELGWRPSLQFEEGIERTVKWYLSNEEWLERVTSGAYLDYYHQMYSERL